MSMPKHPNVPKPRPTMELLLVTPEMAEQWLAKNTRNRNLRDYKAENFKRIITQDDWMLTGETIKFDYDGRLLDGQHRLTGIVKAGVAVWMFVVRGLHPDVQYVLDTGMKRGAGDALRFAGYDNGNALAALARIAIGWQEGHFRYAIQAATHAREITNVEIVEWAVKNEDARDAVVAGESVRKQSPIPGAAASFAALILRRIDADDAAAFFNRITQLRTTGEGDPIYTLLRRYRNAEERREDLRTPQHLFLLFRSWNACRTGEQLYQLKMGNVSAGTQAGTVARIEIPRPL